MEMLREIKGKLAAARASGDAERVEELLDFFVGFGQGLERALRRYADRIEEAAQANNVRLLRELEDGMRALRACLIEWRLIAEELGVFHPASANGHASGGDGCCCPSPVAAPFHREVGDV